MTRQTVMGGEGSGSQRERQRAPRSPPRSPKSPAVQTESLKVKEIVKKFEQKQQVGAEQRMVDARP
jgi:hypothetical protein